MRDIIQIMPDNDDHIAVYCEEDEDGESVLVTREIICWGVRRSFHEEKDGEVMEFEEVVGMVSNFSEISFVDEIEYFICYEGKFEDLTYLEDMIQESIKKVEEEPEEEPEKKLKLVNLGDIRNERKQKTKKRKD